MNLSYLKFAPIKLDSFVISPYEHKSVSGADIKFHKNETTIKSYVDVLSKYVAPVNTVYEMGVADGGSLILWNLVFGCKVVGVDINVKRVLPVVREYFDGHNIHLGNVDLTNKVSVIRFMEDTFVPDGIDIAIDDGAHTIDGIPNNFMNTLPYMNRGSLYFVEDWQALHHTHVAEIREFFAGEDTEWFKNFIVIKIP